MKNRKLVLTLGILILAGFVGFGMVIAKDLKTNSKPISNQVKQTSEGEVGSASPKAKQSQPEQLLKNIHPKANILFTDKGEVVTIVFGLNNNSTTGVAVINGKGELLIDDRLSGANYVKATVKDINKDNYKEIIIDSISEDGMPWCDIYQIKESSVKKLLSVNGSEGVKNYDVDNDGENEIIASSISDDTIYDWDSTIEDFTEKTIGAHTVEVESEPQTAPAPVPAVSYQNAPTSTRTFYAECGAVIVGKTYDDGCEYKEKCDACGYIRSSKGYCFNIYNSSFTCPKCGNHQKVKIGVSSH